MILNYLVVIHFSKAKFTLPAPVSTPDTIAKNPKYSFRELLQEDKGSDVDITIYRLAASETQVYLTPLITGAVNVLVYDFFDDVRV